jgi:hypothetical protein
MLLFKDPDEELNSRFLNRIIKLMSGIELLAIGLNLHTFNTYDFTEVVSTGNTTVENNRINPGLRSKRPSANPAGNNYTVDLLFGDVFYARAVIYILEYGDFRIFDSILDSLKLAHKSRLNLHRRLIEDFNQKEGNFIGLDDTGVNSLLKTSFFIGWGIFSKDEKVKLPYEIINDFVSLKTLNDIGRFFDSFPEKSSTPEKKSFTSEKCRSIKDVLVTKIEDLEPAYIMKHFKYLRNQF